MKFLKREILPQTKENIWIGGYEIDGDWNWQDGSEFRWKNWDVTQPNAPKWADDTNDCAYFWGNEGFQWADAKCNGYNFSFICMH